MAFATRRSHRAAVPALLGAGALSWWCFSICRGFVAGRLPRAVPGRGGVARRAFAFDLATSDEHQGLVLEEEDGIRRVSTSGRFEYGNYNTVLGDAEVPSSGRSYWEVKFVKKPTDAWEYIGVTEPGADVTKKLAQNKKSAGWFWGADLEESFLYKWMEMKPEFNTLAKRDAKRLVQDAIDDGFPEKDMYEYIDKYTKPLWGGKGTTVGMRADDFPPFRKGTIVGVDVDMDKGTLGFWADGKYLGLLKDQFGTPVDLKGKKLLPALSVFGRKFGPDGTQSTIMELRTGLEPPPLP